MTCRDVVWIIPINHPAGPLDGSWGRAGDACWPERELDAAWSVGKLADTAVHSIGSFERTDVLAVD